MNTRESERLKRCIRLSSLRKGRDGDWLDVLEEYDELRKGNIKNRRITKVTRDIFNCKII